MTRSWIRGLALAACVVSTALPGPDGAAAQEPTRSLHGALTDGLTCLDCHTQEAWSPLAEDMAFDHADFGGFVLEGRHADVSCAMCHEGLVFDRASGARSRIWIPASCTRPTTRWKAHTCRPRARAVTRMTSAARTRLWTGSVPRVT